MKSEKRSSYGPKNLIFTNFTNNVKNILSYLLHFSDFIKIKFGAVTWTISNNFCFILFPLRWSLWFKCWYTFPLKANPQGQKSVYRKMIKVKVASNTIPQPNLVQQLIFFINCKNFWKSPYPTQYSLSPYIRIVQRGLNGLVSWGTRG